MQLSRIFTYNGSFIFFPLHEKVQAEFIKHESVFIKNVSCNFLINFSSFAFQKFQLANITLAGMIFRVAREISDRFPIFDSSQRATRFSRQPSCLRGEREVEEALTQRGTCAD